MSQNVRISKKIGASEMDKALQPLLSGDGAREFYQLASRVLTDSASYATMLKDASNVGFDEASIIAGFVAGLRASSELLNTNYDFLITR